MLEIAVRKCTLPEVDSELKQSNKSLKFWQKTAVAVVSAGMLPIARVCAKRLLSSDLIPATPVSLSFGQMVATPRVW